MEIASLIILIVMFVLMIGAGFLTFQIWLYCNELKQSLPKMFEELKEQNMFLNEEVKKIKLSITEHINNSENKMLTKMVEQISSNKSYIEAAEQKLLHQLNNFRMEMEKSVVNLNENFEKVKNNQINLNNDLGKLYKAITEPLDL